MRTAVAIRAQIQAEKVPTGENESSKNDIYDDAGHLKPQPNGESGQDDVEVTVNSRIPLSPARATAHDGTIETASTSASALHQQSTAAHDTTMEKATNSPGPLRLACVAVPDTVAKEAVNKSLGLKIVAARTLVLRE